MLHLVWSRERNDKTLTPTPTGIFLMTASDWEFCVMTVPMHETHFRGKARIVCQTQGKARFRHVSGTGLTHFRSIFGTVYARFRHFLGTVLAQLWHAVCTFYAWLGTFLGKSRKIMTFRGKSWGLPVGKKLMASENYFLSEKLGLCMYFLLQLQLNLQLKKCDSSLLRTTLQAGCHETA